SEKRFQFTGIAMVSIAILACIILLGSIFIQAMPAMTESRIALKIKLDGALVDPMASGKAEDIRAQGDFNAVVNNALIARFPNAEIDEISDDLMEMVSTIGMTPLAIKVSKNPKLIGTEIVQDFALNDDIDMFLKGGFGKVEQFSPSENVAIMPNPAGLYEITIPQNGFSSTRTKIIELLKVDLEKRKIDLALKKSKLQALNNQIKGQDPTSETYIEANSKISEISGEIFTNEAYIEHANKAMAAANGELELNTMLPSLLIVAGGGAYQAQALSNDKILAKQLITPNAPVAKPKLTIIASAEDDRPINDKLAALGLILKSEGAIKSRPNITLLTRSDSNDAEMSGVLSAIIGSLFTLLVTFFVSVPVGVMAAIYLEEFAPKNWLTDLIEVNINNLAAVPSIVFGLLGFSVFLHFFGMPRSAPVVGGIVLSLMSLPVIIIASRAALKAVPPSIREAALGVGASKVQAVFHHVLPLAVPGMMTGSILAMAHALGETAPLLMIGMVAFIADVPKGFLDAATVLPVEVYMWAGRPERAWDARTSGAIIVLLIFMLIMNALAIFLRRKFERRW
ncbi:MAG: phosphate ABC transporter permease PstA, partial [Caulobacterales bacterium]|nr:phosphate ABC transporter permease PstA [Caulobacterales bacterium]